MSNATETYELGTTPEARLKTLTRVREGTPVTSLGVGETITLVHENAAGTEVDTYTAAAGDIVHTALGTWWCTVTTPSTGTHHLHWTAVIGGRTHEWHEDFNVIDRA